MYNKTFNFNKDIRTVWSLLESLPLSMTNIFLSVLLLNLSGGVSMFLMSLASINANESTKVLNNYVITMFLSNNDSAAHTQHEATRSFHFGSVCPMGK